MLGLIVIGGAISIYISTIRSSTDITNSARLNYDLDSVMQLMVNDIRRAGYWGGAIADSSAITNPPTCDEGNLFTCGVANIVISEKTGEVADSCILYTYDADSSGINTPLDVTDDVDLDEYFGFRLNGDGIDMRFSVTATEVTNNTLGCDNGDWESIIDTTKVEITAPPTPPLLFAMTNSKCLNTSNPINTTTPPLNPLQDPCPAAVLAGFSVAGDSLIETRQIDITLTGNIINDAPVTKTLSAAVKVRNNRIFTQ